MKTKKEKKLKFPRWMKEKMKKNVIEIQQDIINGKIKIEDLGKGC